MILSHKHKLIFIKPRKVAGTSFEIALSRFLSEDDIITWITKSDESIRKSHGFLGPRNYIINPDEKGKKGKAEKGSTKTPLNRFFNHCNAEEIRDNIDESIWNTYKKISIVRNPWDRAVSIFYFKARQEDKPADITEFTKYFLERPNSFLRNYPSYFIDGEEVVDYYIRFENFEEDILKLESEYPAMAGLWDTFKNISTKGGYRDKRMSTAEIFKTYPEIDKMVRDSNAWEIEKFAYKLAE
jgi:hypothetical protein